MRTKGYSTHEVTRGTFALPRELKQVIRSGIHGDSFGMGLVDVDLQTSHARAVLHGAAERGMDATPLKHVVENRTGTLAEIHTDKEASKELLNSLINRGSAEAWMHRHGVSYELPKWVEDLRIFLNLSAEKDGTDQPQLLQARKDKKNKVLGVTFWLNADYERKKVNATQALCDDDGSVTVSFEGDGLVFAKRTKQAEEWAQTLLAKANTVAPCTVKPTPAR